MADATPSTPAAKKAGSAWTPLRYPAFRSVWGSWLVVMLAFWMNELAAAWTMATLVDDPLWIAVVPACGTLPIFLFATLAGALSDLVDRRLVVLVSQLLAAAACFSMFGLMWSGYMTPGLLVAALLVHGVSFAFRLPSFSAVVSDSAPKDEVPKAIALSTMATNLARVIGPIVGGGLLVLVGPRWVFLLNGVLCLAVVVSITNWPERRRASALPAERLIGAVRLGFRFVSASPAVLVAICKGAFFFFYSVVTLALMPLLASGRYSGSASTFATLLGAFGVGAVLVALGFPHLRQRWSTNRLWQWASYMNVAACLLLGLSTSLPLTYLAAGIAGGSWMCVASALQIAVQSGLPAWVRARGIAVFQTAVMGASALGAITWGLVASRIGYTEAFMVAASAGAILTLTMLRKAIGDVLASHAELSGADIASELAVGVSPEQGPVVMAIIFRVRPEKVADFIALAAESRASRLRHGAISWSLLRDPKDSETFIEHFVFESWVDRLRQIDHATQADEELRVRKRDLCSEPPVIHRWIASTV